MTSAQVASGPIVSDPCGLGWTAGDAGRALAAHKLPEGPQSGTCGHLARAGLGGHHRVGIGAGGSRLGANAWRPAVGGQSVDGDLAPPQSPGGRRRRGRTRRPPALISHRARSRHRSQHAGFLMVVSAVMAHPPDGSTPSWPSTERRCGLEEESAQWRSFRLRMGVHTSRWSRVRA